MMLMTCISSNDQMLEFGVLLAQRARRTFSANLLNFRLFHSYVLFSTTGGWPTIKYFNKETGPAGKPYTQKTSDPMCTELGNGSFCSF